MPSRRHLFEFGASLLICVGDVGEEAINILLIFWGITNGAITIVDVGIGDKTAG